MDFSLVVFVIGFIFLLYFYIWITSLFGIDLDPGKIFFEDTEYDKRYFEEVEGKRHD